MTSGAPTVRACRSSSCTASPSRTATDALFAMAGAQLSRKVEALRPPAILGHKRHVASKDAGLPQDRPSLLAACMSWSPPVDQTRCVARGMVGRRQAGRGPTSRESTQQSQTANNPLDEVRRPRWPSIAMSRNSWRWLAITSPHELMARRLGDRRDR